jgi:pectin methylesterase-like acyl-CoA thioesterase
MRTGARKVIFQGVRAEVIQETLYVSSLPMQPLVGDTLEARLSARERSWYRQAHSAGSNE